MTLRRLLPPLAVLVLAVIGLSGCVAIKTEGSSTRAPGVVTVSLSICAADHTAGSSCNPPTNTDEPDNGDNSFTGTPTNPVKGRLVVGFRVPTGTVAPDEFASETGEQFNASQSYTDSLTAAIPPATGFRWFGYLSSAVTLVGGAPLTTLNVEFGLPTAADGSPFTGPFLWRAIVGVVNTGVDPNSTACPASSTICFDSPPPATLGTHFQRNISDFRIMPGTPATAAPGQAATVSFPVRYVDNAGFGPRTLNITGTSTLPGNPKVTPASATLPIVGNGTPTMTAMVTVPAGTAPGHYPVTLTATDSASGVPRSNTATLTVVDKTPPAISIGSPTDGEVLAQGQQIAATYSCADEPNGSGLASCAGPVASGAALDTASPGQKTFTVTAADKAGNAASLTRTYTVQAPPPPVVIPSGRERITFSVSFLFAAGKKATKFKKLVVKHVPKGATVRVRCHRKGCPKHRVKGKRRAVAFKKKSKKASRPISLKPWVHKRLRVGIRLRVKVTQRGKVGMVKTVRIRRSKAPKIRTRCLPPGAKKTTRCA